MLIIPVIGVIVSTSLFLSQVIDKWTFITVLVSTVSGSILIAFLIIIILAVILICAIILKK